MVKSNHIENSLKKWEIPKISPPDVFLQRKIKILTLQENVFYKLILRHKKS